MTQFDNTPGRKKGQMNQALREAGIIILLSFAVAIVYNIYAASPVPWIREPVKRDSNTVTLDSLAGTNLTETSQPLDTVRAGGDTAMVTAPIDSSALQKLSQREIDSLAKVRTDSLKLAREEAKRVSDSLKKAESGDLIAKLATATEIQTDVAKRLFDTKGAIFIDARPEDHYHEGHIPGAMNVYAEQWQSQIPELIKISRDQPIVTYCGGGDECELSHDLAKNLKALGFKVVVVYMGGIKDWTAKKYPVAK